MRCIMSWSRPVHRDDGEQAAQELFPEVLRVVDVIEEEDPFVDPDSAEVLADEDDGQDDSHNHARRHSCC